MDEFSVVLANVKPWSAACADFHGVNTWLISNDQCKATECSWKEPPVSTPLIVFPVHGTIDMHNLKYVDNKNQNN